MAIMDGATPTLRQLPTAVPDFADGIAGIQSLHGYVHAGDIHVSLHLALDRIRSIGDRYYLGLKLNFFTPVLVHMGRLDQAEAYLQEALALYTEMGDHWGTGTSYRYMGLVALARGDIADAKRLIYKSLDVFEGYVIGWDIVACRLYLGDAERAEGNSPAAMRHYLDTLDLAVEVNAKSFASDAILGIAELQAQAGAALLAYQLSQFVREYASSSAAARERAVQLGKSLEGELDPTQIKAAHAWLKEQTRASISKCLQQELQI